MNTLSIDIETFSSVNLVKSGVYAYTDSNDFRILLLAYAFNNEEIKITDIACDEKLPPQVISALTDKEIIKTAYNANFEIVCLQKYFNIKLQTNQWRCTAVAASELGLPNSLEEVAKVLKLPVQKDSRGKALIRYFCMPCKPTKVNGGRTVNLPEHDKERWEIFKEYCKRDVEVERTIKNKLSKFPISENEQKLWEIDQKINSRGVKIDTNLVKNAILFNQEHKRKCSDAYNKITGLNNPNSLVQLKKWIYEETGIDLKSISKANIKNIIKEIDNVKVREALKIRASLAKTSISKYEAIQRSLCKDERVRGLLQFYGANRTGRWAGRIVQVQNLPQNHIKDIDLARQTVKDGDFELFDLLFDVPTTLSELIRTAFIPSENNRFIVSDFSAIEARVIAWLAGEKWRLDVFKNNGDIYCASASQMFRVPVVKHGINGHLRQKGKIAELALGYGGGVSAMVVMGALEMGLREEELSEIVKAWRQSNPCIKQFWNTVEKAAIDAINDKPSIIQHNISFIKKKGILFIGLPSGRKIAYIKPRLDINNWGNPEIVYQGMNQQSKKWYEINTWGGKLVENIVQAVARDCLAESIIRLEDRGFKINFHVHDEVILDVPKGISSTDEIAKIMSEPISWAKDLVLKAEAYETEYYIKD